MTTSLGRMYRGTDRLPRRGITLTAGPLSMLLDPESGFLRYIHFEETELLRGVYVAVRDHNWNTILPCIPDPSIQPSDEGFDVQLTARCCRGPIHFEWSGTIHGDASGTVRYHFRGEAKSTFRKNRIGFCVLHPVHCAGLPCTLEHADGGVAESQFPLDIAPHQPFKNLRAITYPFARGKTVEVRMEGDVFETEDQRNWSDASYKTYCTPLDEPSPVELQAGHVIEQTVTLSINEPGNSQSTPTSPLIWTRERVAKLHLNRNLPARPLPQLGLGMASHGHALTKKEAERLRALRLAHLRADLHLAESNWEKVVHAAAEQSRQLRTPLEMAIFLTDEAANELDALSAVLRDVQPMVARWLVFHEHEKTTTERWLRLARGYLESLGRDIPLGSGTNAYFTELNRDRPVPHSTDVACFSVNPQVHAFDDASMVETLAVQAIAVESARSFMNRTPIGVTPVTLRPRFNPNASGEAEADRDNLPPEVDPRQMSLFGACWTLGSLKQLTEGGAAHVTYYETSGWRGVIETEQGSPLPEQFPSTPGGVFPLYHVLADVVPLAAAHAETVSVVSEEPLRVEAMIIVSEGQTRLMVANLVPDELTAVIHGLDGSWLGRRLDETTFESAVEAPQQYRNGPSERWHAQDGRLTVSLRPYACLTLDQIVGDP